MTQAQNEILSAALSLTPAARAELADELLKSLDGDDQAEIDAAWAVEVELRIDQIESGEVPLLPGDDVMAKVRNRAK